jgi:hypothetical protein
MLRDHVRFDAATCSPQQAVSDRSVARRANDDRTISRGPGAVSHDDPQLEQPRAPNKVFCRWCGVCARLTWSMWAMVAE